MADHTDTVLRALRERLSPSAVSHCERVSATAAGLAESYGADTQSARLAGLLHDWHRETPGEELLKRARRLGLEITEVDELVPYLLHGPVAAEEIDDVVPGVDPAVRDAVAAHTYGAPAMSDLAKIVYIADMIEPARHHDHADALRQAAGPVDLDELFARAYTASVAHLIRARRPLHPVTVAVYNRYVARRPR
ncbi:MAG: bis(5'-nucleosyl)-tetraphosphatase (symmetrical) YqeK [Aeromicrobium sp.]|nr:bis(5'-nucleosyl)-tetraphosphatase (symmetrical) YqeK [Aeromicrobium sp.]